MATFELEHEETDDPSVVQVNVLGELDLTNARELEERLAELPAADTSVLLLDVNRVVFIDSAALHVIFRTARRLGGNRFGVVLEPTAPIARTLSIVGLSKATAVGASADEILATLGHS
jgi:anti-anti-sigma factor